MTEVIDSEKGRIVIIEAEGEQLCEECGELSELRPYGKNGKQICFDCMMKDEESIKLSERMCSKRFFNEDIH